MRLLVLSIIDLLARPARFALTVAGLVIAIAAFVALDGLVRGFERTLTETVVATGTHIHVTEKGSIDFLSSLVPEDLSKRFADAPGVEAISPALVRLAPINGSVTAPILGWPQGSYLWRTVAVVDGRLPRPDARHEVAVGIALAHSLHISLGDTLSLLGIKAVVVGRVDTKSQLNRGAVLALLPDLQAATFRNGQVTSINIRLSSEAVKNLPATIARLARRAPGYSVMDSESLVRDNFVLTLTHALSRSVLIIVLLLTFVGILTNMSNSVREHRHELATLRAIGWPVTRIGAFMATQAWTMAAIATAIGIALGAFGVHWVSRLPGVSTYIEPVLSRTTMLWVGGEVLLASLLAVAIPLWTVARIDPSSVLRSP